MPQPLSTFHPNLGYVLASGNTPHDPATASAVLAVINLWSQIDYNYAVILARIANADPVAVTAVFQAMISAEAKKTALFAAAAEKLPAEQSSLIMAVIDTMKPSRTTRNAFAHHLWGALNTRPDRVLLIKPKTLATYTARIAEWRGDGPRPEIDRSEIEVWSQRDFDAEVEKAALAHDRAVQLSFTFDHPAADRRRQSLLADPHIARLYEHRLRENTG